MKFSNLAVSTILATTGATSFDICAGATDDLGITSVAFSEDPLVPGTTLTISVDATPTVDVTDGATLDFVVKFGSFPIFAVTKDFCNDLGVTCPIAAGTPTSAEVVVEIQSTAPSASVTAEVVATNGDGSSLTCVDIPITIGSGSDELPKLTSEVEITEELSKSFFENFKKTFRKTYDSEEEENTRFKHFVASLKRAKDRNSGLEEPNFGVTKFSDLSVEEFREKWLNYKPAQAHDDEARLNADVVSTAFSRKLRGANATPSSFDWRDKGAVTDVKDQGQCGSCWAFSTTETIESAYQLAGNKLTELSIAQIVQCDTGGDDAGCNGGDTITAFDYLKSSGGLAAEADYPYSGAITKGVTGSCDKSAERKVVDGTGLASWSYATPACTSRKCEDQDEQKLADTLSTVAPVSICVNAEPWQDYSSGVLKGDSCKGGYYALDHCVQLIGYDSIDGSNGYWIVRNSWATDWGVDGMIHLEFGSNACGVADEATTVVLG